MYVIKKSLEKLLHCLKKLWQIHYCSDFLYESNGIFVLGMDFFFRQISTFLLASFDGFFKYHSKSIVILRLNLQNISPVIIFCKVMGV